MAKGLRLKAALVAAALLAFSAPVLRAGGLESAKSLSNRFGSALPALSLRRVVHGLHKADLRAGRRIGFMHGTFDPPHAGHRRAMEEAMRSLRLDLLVVAPNIDPSHKPNALSLEDRLAMARLAFADMPRVVVMPLLPVDVLSHRHQSVRRASGFWRSGDQCFWIVGGDWLESASRNPSLDSLLLHGYRVAVIERDGYHAPAPAAHLGRVSFVERLDHQEDVSSTQIRAAISEGLSVDGLLAPAVIDYIRSHHLYADAPEERAPAPEDSGALAPLP